MKKILLMFIFIMNNMCAINVIFDVDALFKVDEIGFLSHVPCLGLIGKEMAKGYTKTYLDLLYKLDFEKDLLCSEMTFRGIKIPALMCSYFLGKTKSGVAKRLADEHINCSYNSWLPSLEKRIMKEAADVGFSPEKQVKSLKPVKRLHDLVRALSNDPRYEIYIFTNKNNETMFELAKQYPELFKLFKNHICCSADLYEMKNSDTPSAHCLKPHPTAYAQFLLYYNLKAEDCYFIEQEANCLKTVENIGAYGCCWSKDAAVKIERDLTLIRES